MTTTDLARTAALAAGLLALATNSAHAALVLARGASWKYLKGTAEASDPQEAWRAPEFDDGAWSEGNAPFRYGDGNGGTVLDDMRDSYTTFYLRRTFNITDVAEISRLDLEVDYDDGFALWINGTEVLAVNAPGSRSFNSLAGTNHESGSFETFELAGPQAFLREGENTIAIQVFNVSSSSSDVMMNPELVSTAPDREPPVVLSVDPPPGNLLALTEVVVNFSEPVVGVDAADLTLNDVEAIAVGGSGDRYTFTFVPGARGAVTLAWAQDHGITDTADPPNAFDQTDPGEVRAYNIVDDVPPEAARIHPPPGVTLRALAAVEVTFSEAVDGVGAADLLAGDTPASGLTGSGAGPYRFTFPEGLSGEVGLSWVDRHGIVDRADEPNAFGGGAWSYTVDPDAAFGNLFINEFVASNRDGLTDAEGETVDWVEIFNFGAEPVELEGWSLSDDPEEPGKWVFPARTLAPGGYLLVFASGKDRAPAGAGELHTSFKLAASGEYLGLFTPDSPRSAADELAPAFPEQRNDHSYGRDSTGTWRYATTPTPRAANVDSQLQGLLAPPHVNTRRGFYDRPFNLALTTGEPGAVIRYTTDGSEPSLANGRTYGAPLRVTSTTVLRAAAFKDGFLPSKPVTHTYFFNVSAARASLPAISLVTDQSNLWGQTGIMETSPRNTTQRGLAWERPTSAELIRPEDNGGFQVDCGLRVQGGNYVRGRYNPNGGLPFSKYSFRLYFRGDYGPSVLRYPFFEGSEVQEFDRIVLRAGMNDHSNPFIVDEIVRRLQIDTGQVASRGNFVNLFINGEYKGYYNPTERIDDDFLRSWHGGDNAWDVIAQFGEVREGDATAWNNLRTLITGRDVTLASNYQAVLEAMDMDNYIDYLLVNIYSGTGDWPHNNWRSARERVPGAKFRFYVWDAEWSLGNLGRSVNGNTITGELARSAEISDFFQSLSRSPEFRIRFADRVHHHYYNGGALEDNKVLDHYETMRSEMSGVLPGLSTSIRNTWVPNRRGIIMQHMADADPADAPVFSQHGGSVPPGYELSVDAPGGTIYYTLDGTDPRAPLAGDDGGSSRTLLEEDAAKRVLVPDADIGNGWTGTDPLFDDAGWTPGTGGVGYDEAGDYQPLFDIDVDAAMNDVNTSVYVRVPFTVDPADLEGVNFMQLLVRYDDGFVAYLNGVRVASANGPASPAWNSEATGNNSDASAINLRSFNITDGLGELREGDNLLAVHGLNDGLGSSDFLLSAALSVGENRAGETSDTAVEYTGPLTLNGNVKVKARTFRNGAWSALTEAEFFHGPDTPQLRITELMYNPEGGGADEFIELENVGSRPLDLGHMRMDGIEFAFSPGTVLAPGARLVLASNDDPAGFAARHPGVIVAGHFRGSLDNGGERIALLDAFGRTVTSVEYDDGGGWPGAADGAGRSLVLTDREGDPDNPASWSASAAPGGTPGEGDPPPPAPAVRINEVMADNIAAVENGGLFPDWVELHNPGGEAVDLSGWGFSDSGGEPGRFTFPAGTEIPAGGHLVLWCDTDDAAPGLHAGFGLDREGETLFLSDASGSRVDAVELGPQLTDLATARAGDVGAWTLAAPTPGSANGGGVSLAGPDSLVINEWMADPVPGEDDWLELYNTDPGLPVALRGLLLGGNGTHQHYGPLGFLGAGSHLRLWADQGTGPDHLDFRISGGGDTLTLSAPDGATLDSVTVQPGEEGASYGRFPDGAAAQRAFPDTPSPGAANYLMNNPGLVLNELLAKPGDGSAAWLELFNSTAGTFNPAGYSLAIGGRESARFVLPQGVGIDPGGYLVVTCDGLRPASAQPGDLNTGTGLSAAGGAVFLYGPDGRLIDQVAFGAQVSGASIGLAPIGGWSLMAEVTPGASNALRASLGNPDGLRINEWLANPSGGSDDFIELYNPSGNPVALAGLRLTDDLSSSGYEQFTFPPLNFIAAGGFLALTADSSPARGPGHLPFSLDASGETLRLHAADLDLIDEVTWGIETEGVSSGRLPDGDDAIAALPAPTPGLSNATDPDADSDGDGISDAWEELHGLDPNSAGDAEEDADGDGRSNRVEFLSGTDPRDPASRFTVDSSTRDLTGFTLRFTARAGIRYTVQFTDDLATGIWLDITTLEPAPTDRPAEVLDPGANAANGRFYRLQASP